MLKRIAIAALCGLLFSNTQTALACDACGCGVGSYQFGILPQQMKNFVGVRYQQKSDRTTPMHGSQSEETFQSTEIWGRFYPLKRVQVLTLLPYNFNRQVTGTKVTKVQGVGDALVLVNYNLINNADSLYQPVKHNLFVGGGLKLPTGNFERQAEGVILNPNLQLGTGSLDFVANAMYTIRYNRIGLNTNATFKHNTANRNEFRFGDRAGLGATLFSVINFKDLAIMPNAGVLAEVIGKDSRIGQLLLESGGQATYMSVGTEFYFRNCSAGLTAQKPVSQNVSEGYVKTGNRLLTHLTFMF